MGAYIDRTVLIAMLIIGNTTVYGQCKINDRGINAQIEGNQHPYSVFYRGDQNGAFNYEQKLIDALNTFRTDLREMVNNGKGDSKEDAKDKYAFIPVQVYDKLFKYAFAPIEDYITERYKDGGQTYYTGYEEVRRHGFATQLKAKAFVLLCATNLEGSRLANAPTVDKLGMKHPIHPSAYANYLKEMFTTYSTTI
jgi:hypothetical protein